MEGLLFRIINFVFFHFLRFQSNFLDDRPWLMGALNCRGPLVFELTLPSELYATEGGGGGGGAAWTIFAWTGGGLKICDKGQPQIFNTFLLIFNLLSLS
jgi:hypothetical protein